MDSKVAMSQGLRSTPASIPRWPPAYRTSPPQYALLKFRFNAPNGVCYRIETSSDLKQWDVIEPGIFGQSEVVKALADVSTRKCPIIL